MLSEEITRLRNRIITGTYAIGEEGKEPINWKDYALKLEAYIMKLKNERIGSVVTLFPEFVIKSFENGFLSFHQLFE